MDGALASDDRRTLRTVNGTTTRTLWSGADEGGEYDASGVLLRRFIPDGSGAMDARLAAVEADGTVTWLHVNHQGSVVATSNASGAVRGWAGYSPSGELGTGLTAPPPGSPFGYAGRQWDAETGLWQYRARYYSPRLGQFLSTDPIGMREDHNLYLYVGLDPVNNTDPTGLAPNQAGATNPAHVTLALRNGASLSELAAQSISNENRYFYTDRFGWVDIRHFATAAQMVMDGTSPNVVVTLGFLNEIAQTVDEGARSARGSDVYRSGFSPEDLPSNSAGAEFGLALKKSEGNVADTFVEWATRAGARRTSDPKSGYSDLPSTDPSAPTSGDTRGSALGYTGTRSVGSVPNTASSACSDRRGRC